MQGIWFEESHLYQLEAEVRHLVAMPKRSIKMDSGAARSSIAGRGLDFSELKNYQPGDDVRHIDWRASAKLGKTFSKVFTEERQRPVLLVLDQTSNMFFGSKDRFKAMQACQIAAIFAWQACFNQDKLGGLIQGETGLATFQPSISKGQNLHFLHALIDENAKLNKEATSSLNWQHLLEELIALRPRSADIILISDFISLTDEHIPMLAQLSAHNQIRALHVYDPAEQILPKAADFSLFSGGLKLLRSQANPKYQDTLKQHWQNIEQLFSQLGVQITPVSTRENALDKLQQTTLFSK